MIKCLVIIISGLFAFCIFESKAQDNSTLTDIDGNIYKIIIVGSYLWMAENLKTTHYNDGTEISNIREDSIWINLNSDAFCWYNNNDSNAQMYGAMYNWYTVNTSKLCPDGWRIPSDEEWKYMEGFVDSKYNIGDTLWNNLRNRGYDVGMRLKSLSD